MTIKSTNIPEHNIVELSGGGCAWKALIKASKKDQDNRYFIGTTDQVKSYLGKSWTVQSY